VWREGREGEHGYVWREGREGEHGYVWREGGYVEREGCKRREKGRKGVYGMATIHTLLAAGSSATPKW
jgi:hypothetical protein